MNRRRMMTGRKFRIKYDLNASEKYSYIQHNGEGEKLCGSGEIEIKKGDFLFCYANGRGPYIEKDGETVAQGALGAATYEFYPESDAKITYHLLEGSGSHMTISTK